MRKNLPVTQKEIQLRDEQRLITATDRNGVITYCNDAFADISGFTREELLGQPHNLIRHPDVPSAVFAHLWSYLKQGRSWMGIVKNRTKSGDHYWVNAFITPIREGDQVVGFESVRVKATPAEIARTVAFYQRLDKGRGVPVNWSRQLFTMAPATLCSLIGAAGIYLAGPVGLIPALLLAAPIGLLLQQHRDRRLIRLFRSAESNITDPLLAQMYTDQPGPLGRLEMALYSHEARLRTCITRVDDFTEQLRQQATRSRELSHQSSEQLERQRAETDMVAAAINEMAAASQEVAGNVARTAEATQMANQQADQGKQVASLARDAIESLTEAVSSAATAASRLASDAQEIGTVVDVIRGIAEQTNLLALNAA